MNILITGCSGFLGQGLIKELKAHQISALGRKRFESKYIMNHYGGNLDAHSNYEDALMNKELVIHCAARVHIMDDKSSNALEEYREVNTAGTINLATQAAQAGVKRFIFISSIKVNGESTAIDKPFTSKDMRQPQDPYGVSKSEAEVQLLQLAKDTGLEVVIIRPTLIYGPGVKANFASLLNLVSKGLPLPFGCITTNKRSLVSVTNLVDLIVTCIDHPKASNQVFLVSDDHDISTALMVKEMSKALEKPNRSLPIPLWCYHLAGKVLNKQDVVDRLLGSLQVDISHTKETLNWTPPQSLESGFRETAKAFLKNKEINK
jgi:UDP-glucose 4-epimerase